MEEFYLKWESGESWWFDQSRIGGVDTSYMTSSSAYLIEHATLFSSIGSEACDATPTATMLAKKRRPDSAATADESHKRAKILPPGHAFKDKSRLELKALLDLPPNPDLSLFSDEFLRERVVKIKIDDERVIFACEAKRVTPTAGPYDITKFEVWLVEELSATVAAVLEQKQKSFTLPTQLQLLLRGGKFTPVSQDGPDVAFCITYDAAAVLKLGPIMISNVSNSTYGWA